MVGYVVRRLLLAASMVWAVSFGAFCAFGLSFDPTYVFATDPRPSAQAARRALIAQFHLHDGILHRYWLWLSSLPSEGFGHTVLWFGRAGAGQGADTAIGPRLWPALWVTVQLLAVSLVLVVVFSTIVGVVSARFSGSALDGFVRLGTYLLWSVPTFVVGVLLLRWLGPTGWFVVDGEPSPGLGGWIRKMTLPAIALSVGLIGVYSRYVRSGMVVALQQPYAVVARAKGLPERRVLFRHALRNSLIPFVSVMSLELGAIVGAALAAEYVFHLNGLANLFLSSVGAADPFQMTAILVVLAGTVAICMLLGDLVIGWLDPRTRVGVGR